MIVSKPKPGEKLLNLNLRRARLEEANLLTELCVRSKQSNGYDDAFMEACRAELTVTENHMMQGEYWVAENDRVCGCICLGMNKMKSVGEVHAFFIEPDCRRMGIGKMLWSKLLERARAKELAELYLDSDPFAVQFYEKLGFEITESVASGSISGRTLPRMKFLVNKSH